MTTTEVAALREVLKEINAVQPPPHYLTRIKAKLVALLPVDNATTLFAEKPVRYEADGDCLWK
jgi:hypothetical protein